MKCTIVYFLHFFVLLFYSPLSISWHYLFNKSLALKSLSWGLLHIGHKLKYCPSQLLTQCPAHSRRPRNIRWKNKGILGVNFHRGNTADQKHFCLTQKLISLQLEQRIWGGPEIYIASFWARVLITRVAPLLTPRVDALSSMFLFWKVKGQTLSNPKLLKKKS